MELVVLLVDLVDDALRVNTVFVAGPIDVFRSGLALLVVEFKHGGQLGLRVFSLTSGGGGVESFEPAVGELVLLSGGHACSLHS